MSTSRNIQPAESGMLSLFMSAKMEIEAVIRIIYVSVQILERSGRPKLLTTRQTIFLPHCCSDMYGVSNERMVLHHLHV